MNAPHLVDGCSKRRLCPIKKRLITGVCGVGSCPIHYVVPNNAIERRQSLPDDGSNYIWLGVCSSVSVGRIVYQSDSYVCPFILNELMQQDGLYSGCSSFLCLCRRRTDRGRYVAERPRSSKGSKRSSSDIDRVVTTCC